MKVLAAECKKHMPRFHIVVMQERLEAAAHEQEQKLQRATNSVEQQLQRLEPERRKKLEAQVRLELHREANSKIKEVTCSNSIF